MSEIEANIRFQVLGPLRVHTEAGELAIRAVRERTVLGMLLLHPGETVAVQRLVDAVWDEEPPQNARNQLQGCVSRLRRQLATAGVDRHVITTTTQGYQLDVDSESVDLLRFRQLRDGARVAERHGDHEGASERYRSALRLWRGPVLGDVDSRVAHRIAAALEEERAQALEERIEIDLALGAAGELVAELTALVEQHPYREALYGALMRALYRAGRQAEALAAYQRVRKILRNELGAEPGEYLRRVHQAILRQDSDLKSSRSKPVRDRDDGVSPRTLPADVAGFAGRLDALARLDKFLSGGDRALGPVVISAIAGAAGVGKTALAVHWAHQIADRFPDGQLYVNLRGFDPAGRAIPPAEAVRGFLDILGVPGARLPTDLDGQAALYRSLLAGRRMLVLLDNARDAEQVRPLLPGTPTALVVVTSRNQLTPLVATEGARPLNLDLLSTEEARELLARRLGADRVAAERDAVDAIIDTCARLPLALAIVAARVEQTGFRLATFAAELRDADRRLDALDAGDPASEVRAVFSWSYRALSPPAARLFRLLGLHPGPDFSSSAAASLAGIPPAEARRLLTELVRASLLTEHIAGRYTWHDLIRAYAADCAERDEGTSDRRVAVMRLLDHYTYNAYAADRLMRQLREPMVIPLAHPAAGSAVDRLTEFREAFDWLRAEHRVLIAAQQLATDHGLYAYTWQLAWSLNTFLVRQGQRHDQGACWRAALQAARRLRNPAAQAYAHELLATSYLAVGRYDDAEDNLNHALDLDAQQGNRAREGHARITLAQVLVKQGRVRQALDHTQMAVALCKAADDGSGTARALNAVGWCLALLGHHDRALDRCQQALTVAQELGDDFQEAHTWDSLGYAHLHLGHHAQAVDSYRHAIALWRELGDRYPRAFSLTHLGNAYHADGNSKAAGEAWQEALDILIDLNHPDADDVQSKLDSLKG